MQTIKFFIPTWAISALINDDRSGLEDADETMLDMFLERIKENHKPGHFSPPDDEPYFRHRNDIDGNIAGDVYEVDYVMIGARLFASERKDTPYRDSNFNDLTNDVEKLTESVKADILKDPDYYAELVADMYFHWQHQTFETPLMVMFKTGVNDKK